MDQFEAEVELPTTHVTSTTTSAVGAGYFGILGVVKAAAVAGLIGAGSLAVNWVMGVNDSQVSTDQIIKEIVAQGVKLDNIVETTIDTKEALQVQRELALAIQSDVAASQREISDVKEISMQTSREFNQYLINEASNGRINQ